MSKRSIPSRDAHGFSLVETAIATVLVGGLFVVAMNMVGASRITQARYADRQQALLLAEDLLNHILTLPYQDPGGGSVSFGLEVGEPLGIRASFDDADDFHNYVESPPNDADGNAIPGTERFIRSVEVRRVKRDDPRSVSTLETGVKQITVTVTLANKVMAELSGYRTSGWPAAEQMSEATP